MNTIISVDIVEPIGAITHEEAMECAYKQREIVQTNFLKQGFEYWFTDHNMEYWKRHDGIATICQ